LTVLPSCSNCRKISAEKPDVEIGNCAAEHGAAELVDELAGRAGGGEGEPDTLLYVVP